MLPISYKIKKLPEQYQATHKNIAPAKYGEDDQLGYVHSDRCIICTAKNDKGYPLRDLFDSFALHATHKEGMKWLQEHGIKVVSTKSVIAHLAKHAPYVAESKKLASQQSQKMIVKIHQEKVEASKVVGKIITAGSAMIDDGTMPVTERLLIEAIKEEGRRGVKTSMDTEFETMDEDFVKKAKELKNGSTS